VRFELAQALTAIGAAIITIPILVKYIKRLRRKPAPKIKLPPPLPPAPIKEVVIEPPKMEKAAEPVKVKKTPISKTATKKTAVPAQPVYTERDKKRAKRAIELTFKTFFFTYLGNKSFRGILNHPGNIEPGPTPLFRESRLPEIEKESLAAKAKLVHELKKELAILNDKKIETEIHAICQNLVDITDLFTINDTFQKEHMQKIYEILDTSK
jgi:hypothetical protein